MKEYIRIIENNEHEGEAWAFYVNKNHPNFEDLIQKCEKENEENDFDPPFLIGNKVYSEERVNEIIEIMKAEASFIGSYMASHSKVDNIKKVDNPCKGNFIDV